MDRATATRSITSPGDATVATQREVDWVAAACGAIICVMYGVAYELSGDPVRETFLGAVWYSGYAIVAKKGRLSPLLRELTLAITLFGSIRMQWLAGGMLPSGLNAMWGLVTLIGVSWIGSRWKIRYWVAGFLLALAFEVGLEIAFPPATPTRPSWFPLALAFANCAFAGTFISLFSSRIHLDRRMSAAALTKELERSESLLLNILPASIARKLKRSPGSSIAERFDEVTVLFADIVGFTQLANRVSPTELVDTLDQLFREFDRIAVARGLEKIKTIGDSYMAVAGAPLARADHADVTADAALEMLEVVRRDYAAKGLAVRVGIESGPVVAGVIGTLKFTYDLWGATVNVASRMESHGTAGTIHVGPGAHERLRSRYQLEAREPVDVKGLGIMRTWFLTGRTDPATRARD